MVKPHHRPLAAYKLLSWICIGLLFTAFLLSLLVGLSLPIIKPIYLLSFYSTRTGQVPTSVATELRFGVWGVCATSVLDPPTIFTNDGECFGPMLGYTIPEDIIALTDISSDIIDDVENVLLVLLVLHPVAAGLSFFTAISSLFLASHPLSILSLVLSIITALVTTVVFAVDLALVIVAKSKVTTIDSLDFAIQWGNAPWMGLTAALLTWLAVIALSARACYCFGVRRHGKF
ncbi:actin cortical patch SUR7/pH-response regulator pali [Mycena maculata]|uniref:Actin cortical patch SUR7/pH-response regulator pali n=1 Tax=Mycena maculata TaxID=230809 RepID=A0AAD7NYN3_9AGAR|nr:actin cortical patch SUR7/pH-response regulator pali [Mycena maculata]